MDLVDIEAGPWGAFVLLVFLVGVIYALAFTTWIVTAGVIALIVAIVAVVLYFGGRRISRRLVHGKRRG